MVSYYSESNKLYIFAGKYPLPSDAVIQASELSSSNMITLRLRPSSGSSPGNRGGAGAQAAQNLRTMDSLPDGPPKQGNPTSASKASAAQRAA